jgi:hypothetical protein
MTLAPDHQFTPPLRRGSMRSRVACGRRRTVGRQAEAARCGLEWVRARCSLFPRPKGATQAA